MGVWKNKNYGEVEVTGEDISFSFHSFINLIVCVEPFFFVTVTKYTPELKVLI